MTTVFRDMGKSAERLCLLDASDSEFAYVAREFAANPPGFRYAQAQKGKSAENSVVLEVRLISLEPQHATVRATYVDVHFSEFRYELAYNGSNWKVVSKEFVMAE